jgi:uncharacterized membrane protein required for colicin V production
LDLLDLIFVGIIVLGGWNGYRTGLIRQIMRLFGAVIAYFLSLWLKPYVAPAVATFLQRHQTAVHTPAVLGLFLGDLSGAIAFGLVFVVTFLLLRYAIGLVDALFQLPILSTVNRLAGLVVGLILAIVFVFVATLVAGYVNNDWLQTQLHHSSFVHWLSVQQWSQWGGLSK